MKYEEYLNRKVKRVDRERLSMVSEIEYDHTLDIRNINHIVQNKELKPLIGYHQFDDGSRVACAYTRMDGITREMINWWFIWMELDPRRYQLWFPKEHFSMGKPTEKDMKRYFDESMPLYERKWYTTSHPEEGIGIPKWISSVLKGIGIKLSDVTLNFKRPKDIGIREEILEKDDLKSFICAESTNGMFDFPVTVLHYMIEDEKGIDFHSRFWLGKKYDGVSHLKLGKNPPKIASKKLVKHCLEEFTSLSGILEEIYNLEKGEIS